LNDILVHPKIVSRRVSRLWIEILSFSVTCVSPSGLWIETFAFSLSFVAPSGAWIETVSFSFWVTEKLKRREVFLSPF
jgi:hypothetical protein